MKKTSYESRIAELHWDTITQALDSRGFAHIPSFLKREECEGLREQYANDERFRSRIVMARHGYGQGEYSYFDYPLPSQLAQMRSEFYARIAPLANSWNERLKLERRFPETLAQFCEQCHAAGQVKATPLILKYKSGDYNRLHQDLYGEIAFPLQMVFLLSQPDREFAGGEFVMTEQKPRSQSRVYVASIEQGDALIFAGNERPVAGTRGWYRCKMRHGVSELTAGQRYTLGLIFHDAS